MNRKEYIEGLEKIRKNMQEIGAAFAAVDLTDATGMERDRRKKTAKSVNDLCDRLYEDIAISAKVAADKAEAGEGEQDDLFADAARNAKAAEAEVVDVHAAEQETLALPAPADPLDGLTQLPGDSDEPKPTKKAGKKSSKGGKAKKTGKKKGGK